MPATAESFRDTGGHRKVYEISIILIDLLIPSIASSRSVGWIVTPNVRVFRLTMVNDIHTDRTGIAYSWCIADAIFDHHFGCQCV